MSNENLFVVENGIICQKNVLKKSLGYGTMFENAKFKIFQTRLNLKEWALEFPIFVGSIG